MVNLIPKRKKKISKNQKILLYSLVFILIGLTTSYIVLMSLKNKAQAELVSLENQIEAQKSEELSDLEEVVQSYKIKVDQFGEYLNSHIIITKVFDFIEDNTHPHVFFSQLSLSSISYTVNLSGQADSFLSLGQQLIIFNNNEDIKGVSLSNISLSETGDILFNVRLTLNQELFKY
jgi:uncharacterized membrane protein YvbJ